MTATLKEIKAPIEEEMRQFQKTFYGAIKSRIPLLNRIMNYMVRRKGKQVRPMFVFLSCGTCGEINEATYRGATLIELIHTATLIHDDVVDDAYQRRGFFSINALWKNKISVLVGDYLLSRSLLQSLEHGDFEMLRKASEAIRLMSEGELLQIEKARSVNIKESLYFDIIRMKTASLIASSCAIGAFTNGQSEENIEKMRVFGEKTGIAFQIKDDLFDFGDNDSGKPKRTDIKEKKVTLPLIYTLNNVESSVRKRLINTIKHHNQNKERVTELIDMVYQAGGVEYARKMMEQYTSEAFEILDEFPESRYRESLRELVKYAVNRNR